MGRSRVRCSGQRILDSQKLRQEIEAVKTPKTEDIEGRKRGQ
jgi:hypothetical protein